MTACVPWQFLSAQIPQLLKDYSICFDMEDTCIEYYIVSRDHHLLISRQLTISHEIFSGNIFVSKFYPEICQRLNSKYLSAACFYLIVHHAVRQFKLPDHCCVNLETEISIFDNFYSRLNDFNFKVFYHRPAQRVYLRGVYNKYPFQTNTITQNCTTDAQRQI